MKKYFLISDVHGMYSSLVKLLEQCPDDHEPIILGDLVDRGPQSREVISLVKKRGIRCVMGNHDHMMVDKLTGGDAGYMHGIWEMNGGDKTQKEYPDAREHMVSHAEFLKEFPLAIVDEEQKLILSHTGHYTAEDEFTTLWARGQQFPKDGYFRVFGHTPVEKPVLRDTYAMIDTGAAYGGKLTAMLWPKKTFISV